MTSKRLSPAMAKPLLGLAKGGELVAFPYTDPGWKRGLLWKRSFAAPPTWATVQALLDRDLILESPSTPGDWTRSQFTITPEGLAALEATKTKGAVSP